MLNNKVLITGSNGFIGKHLLKFLKIKKFNIISLNHITQRIIKKKIKLNYVFHLFFKINNNKKNFKINLNQIKKCISLCKKTDAKLIFFSSDLPRSININLKNKMTLYHKSKLACEDEIINNLHHKKYLILRISNIFSKDLNQRGVISDLIKKIKKNHTLKIKNYSCKRDFVFIEDLIKILFQIFEKKSGIYFLRSGNVIDIKSLSKIIKNTINKNCNLIFDKKYKGKDIFAIKNKTDVKNYKFSKIENILKEYF